MEDSLQDMRLDDVEESAEFPLTEGITDVSIQVQSTVMHVNKGILMVASPVFHKMLTSDFKEKEDGLIVLPEKNVDDVTLLLKSVYPNKHVTYTDEVVDTLLPLASEYMIQSVINTCEEFLISKYFSEKEATNRNVDDLMKFLNYGTLYEMERLRKVATDLLSKQKSNDIIEHSLFQSIPGEEKAKIFIARLKQLEDDCTVSKKEFIN